MWELFLPRLVVRLCSQQAVCFVWVQAVVAGVDGANGDDFVKGNMKHTHSRYHRRN